MNTKRFLIGVAVLGAMLLLVTAVADTAIADSLLIPRAQLGKSIFFDQHLSLNQNQACATCHAPEVGWTGPDPAINLSGAVYEGSLAGRFGNRKPPSSSYATFSPILHFVSQQRKVVFIGGNFWDGRATGQWLGSPATDQAQGPFLNPMEQALPDSACVVYRVCNPVTPGAYPVSFESVWGADACAITWPPDIEPICAQEGTTVALASPDLVKVRVAYEHVALSIEAYEASPEVNAFTAKFDAVVAKQAKLTKAEKNGLNLFTGKAKCAKCHTLNSTGKTPALFTDFTYANLGVPKNPSNPIYQRDPSFIDLGLGAFLAWRADYAPFAAENNGKQKVPTLRNVDKRPAPGFIKAYTHNGYFKTLAGLVHFYNTRNVLPRCFGNFTEAQALAANCWPEPEVVENMNISELGDLRLSSQEEAELVAFLQTLSDGFIPNVQATNASFEEGFTLAEALADGAGESATQVHQLFLPVVIAKAQ